MCPTGPSVRGESLNGELSRVFRDTPAFYATLRGVNPQTIWNKGHTRDKTLAEGATGEGTLPITVYEEVIYDWRIKKPLRLGGTAPMRMRELVRVGGYLLR